MANWSILKNAIASVIKTNGNQEITGQILQNTLNSIVNTVGENATFAGIATPSTNPGTSDGPVFYIASEPGTYVNFGGIKLKNPGFIVLYNINKIWKSLKTYECLQELGGSQQFPLSQKAITDWINEGYQFRGIATPDTNPGTPSGPVFYLAAENGTYSNFGGKVISNNEIAILVYFAKSWHVQYTGISSEMSIGYIKGRYVSRDGGKINSYNTLCYSEIPYTLGDEISVKGAIEGRAYDKYNFFADETFISSSNDLSSIPENCNKIKINGDVSVGIIVTINGKGANLFSSVKILETEIRQLLPLIANNVSETKSTVDNIISDESVEKQYINLQDNVNVSNVFQDSPGIKYIPGIGYTMKATRLSGAKTKLPFNYTSGKRVALLVTIFFNNVTDDFLFQFGFNTAGWDKATGDIKASDYGLSNFTGTTQTFAIIWDATKASNPYFYIYKSEVAPGQTEEYTITNFAVVDMGSNAEENELYNLTAEQLVEIFRLSTVKGNNIQYKKLIVKIAKEAEKISLDGFLQKEKFYNKKLITLGDSLTVNCKWQPRLCNLTGLLWSEDETKNGVGYVNKGTGEYTTEDKSSDPNYRKAYKMAIGGTSTLPVSVNSVYMRSFDAKFYNPEIILIYSGQNDPIGMWKTPTNSGTTPYEIVENEVPYKDNKITRNVSVISAYRGMVENLMKDKPNAIIYLVTQMRVLGVVGMELAGGGIRFNTQQDIVDWEFSERYPKVEYIRAIGKLYGLPVIDLWDKSGITDYNSKYWYGNPASDCTQVHPNEIGYYRMADVMKQTM